MSSLDWCFMDRTPYQFNIYKLIGCLPNNKTRDIEDRLIEIRGRCEIKAENDREEEIKKQQLLCVQEWLDIFRNKRTDYDRVWAQKKRIWRREINMNDWKKYWFWDGKIGRNRMTFEQLGITDYGSISSFKQFKIQSKSCNKQSHDTIVHSIPFDKHHKESTNNMNKGKTGAFIDLTETSPPVINVVEREVIHSNKLTPGKPIDGKTTHIIKKMKSKKRTRGRSRRRKPKEEPPRKKQKIVPKMKRVGFNFNGMGRSKRGATPETEKKGQPSKPLSICKGDKLTDCDDNKSTNMYVDSDDGTSTDTDAKPNIIDTEINEKADFVHNNNKEKRTICQQINQIEKATQIPGIERVGSKLQKIRDFIAENSKMNNLNLDSSNSVSDERQSKSTDAIDISINDSSSYNQYRRKQIDEKHAGDQGFKSETTGVRDLNSYNGYRGYQTGPIMMNNIDSPDDDSQVKTKYSNNNPYVHDNYHCRRKSTNNNLNDNDGHCPKQKKRKVRKMKKPKFAIRRTCEKCKKPYSYVAAYKKHKKICGTNHRYRSNVKQEMTDTEIIETFMDTDNEEDAKPISKVKYPRLKGGKKGKAYHWECLECPGKLILKDRDAYFNHMRRHKKQLRECHFADRGCKKEFSQMHHHQLYAHKLVCEFNPKNRGYQDRSESD